MQDLQDQINRFYAVDSETPTNESITDEIKSRILCSNRDLVKWLRFTNPDLKGPILDIGCGTGVDTVVLLRMAGYNAVGIDLSLNRIKLGQAVASRLNVNPDCLRIQTIQDLKDKYDIIIGNDIVHHFVDYQAFLSKIYDLLNPGGYCLFLEPSIFPFGFLKSNYKDGEFYQVSDCIEILLNPIKVIRTFKNAGFKNVSSFANCYHPKITSIVKKIPLSKYLWHVNFFYAEK